MEAINAMKQAMEFVKANHSGGPDAFELIETLDQAIKQEALQAMHDNAQELGLGYEPVPVKTYSGGKAWPVQTEWVGLTDDEAQQMRADCATTPPDLVDVRYGWAIHYARAIEAKLKALNYPISDN
jgi:hypothetical protein